jgi:hypothetical protein
MSEGVGFLLFKKPNRFTKQVSVSPPIHIISYACSWDSNKVSPDEIFAVGTQSGSSPVNQERIDEYVGWRQGKLSLDDIIFKNNIILDVDEYSKLRPLYYNEQMRKWFGPDLCDSF